MIDSIILLIGNLVLPYLIMSLFAMLLVEFLAQVFSLRAKTLYQSIRDMLGVQLANELYEHPLIRSLSPRGRKPAYIPGQVFALALVDEVREKTSTDNFAEAIHKLGDSGVAAALQALNDRQVSEVRTVREWFWDVMDQASGLYRWRTLVILAAVAFTLVVALNFDAIQISNYVAERELNSKILEALISDSAKDDSKAGTPTTKEQNDGTSAGQKIRSYTQEFQSPKLPIGWTSVSRDPNWIFAKIVGLLTSVLAIMLCAPLLFDVLNKFSIVRFTVKPYERLSYDEPIEKQ